MFVRVWSSEFFVELSEIRFILLWIFFLRWLLLSSTQWWSDSRKFLNVFIKKKLFQWFERLTLQTKLLLNIFISVMIILYKMYKSCWAREINLNLDICKLRILLLGLCVKIWAQYTLNRSILISWRFKNILALNVVSK